ncbi:MAG TPA: ParB/RepB/Spo0J family partition protein [Gemmatimonadaceae bacterium]
MSTEKPRRLGRGLEALIATKAAVATTPTPQDRSALQRIPVAHIKPNPYQPRKEFRPGELDELEASLRATGLLQPITVRAAQHGSGYELIAGERRLRAATRLGWTDIPAVIKEIDDRTLLTLALVENLQRSDLNPIEEAEGYQRLIDEFDLTQQQVAEVIGKDRSTVANLLRILQLPERIRQMLQQGHLTIGHARAILSLGNERLMMETANEVVAKGLTVRDVEQRARTDGTNANKRRTKEPAQSQHGKSTPEAKRLADELRRHLQTDVAITLADRERGKIEIAFYSADDLDRLLEVIIGYKRDRT